MLRNLRHPDNASPDDPNEISFSKGEVLEILDKNGKWWQARKSDGTVGSECSSVPAEASFTDLPPQSHRPITSKLSDFPPPPPLGHSLRNIVNDARLPWSRTRTYTVDFPLVLPLLSLALFTLLRSILVTFSDCATHDFSPVFQEICFRSEVRPSYRLLYSCNIRIYHNLL